MFLRSSEVGLGFRSCSFGRVVESEQCFLRYQHIGFGIIDLGWGRSRPQISQRLESGGEVGTGLRACGFRGVVELLESFRCNGHSGLGGADLRHGGRCDQLVPRLDGGGNIGLCRGHVGIRRPCSGAAQVVFSNHERVLRRCDFGQGSGGFGLGRGIQDQVDRFAPAHDGALGSKVNQRPVAAGCECDRAFVVERSVDLEVLGEVALFDQRRGEAQLGRVARGAV